MGTVRSSYYTDDLCAWQDLEDGRCNWTCADGTGPGNMQTIAIECIMSGRDGAENLKARDNAARLAAYLLHKNGLTADNLYTHTYWLHVRDGHTKLSDTANIDKWCTAPHAYKNCPLYIIPDWIGFKKQVDGYIKKLGGSSVVSGGTFLVRVLDPALNIRAQPSLTAKINGVIRDKSVYTIVATSFEPKTQITWGKLKSGAGWISLGSKYVKKTVGGIFMKNNFKKWFKAAGIRALKTVAQTAIATIGTSAVISEVNWLMVASTSVLAGILSLLTSVAGLPEVDE